MAGISAATAAAISIASTAVSTAVGVYSSIRQGKAAQAQADYQAKVAKQNQDLAEQQASAERMAGYEEAQATRRRAAQVIGSQRAAAGASGAVVDFGSNLDLQADTAANAELDAINAYNKGIDSAYNSQIQAWNYGQQATAYEASGQAAKNAGYLNAASTALGGIADMGSTWAGYKAQQPSTKPTGGVSGSQRVADNYKGVPRMTDAQWNKLYKNYGL